MVQEWKWLWQKGMFRANSPNDVKEWSDVARDERHKQKELHMGIVFGMMVEKNAELDISDEKESSNIVLFFKATVL